MHASAIKRKASGAILPASQSESSDGLRPHSLFNVERLPCNIRVGRKEKEPRQREDMSLSRGTEAVDAEALLYLDRREKSLEDDSIFPIGGQ